MSAWISPRLVLSILGHSLPAFLTQPNREFRSQPFAVQIIDYIPDGICYRVSAPIAVQMIADRGSADAGRLYLGHERPRQVCQFPYANLFADLIYQRVNQPNFTLTFYRTDLDRGVHLKQPLSLPLEISVIS
jgi:hypothetical protein